MRFAVCLLASLPLASAGCQPGSIVESPAEFTSECLQAVVDDYLKADPTILGVIADIDIQGARSYQAAGGFVDLSRTALMEPETRVIVGSVTKMFTAVLVLQLMEAGQVRLDGPLLEYLPSDWSAMLGRIAHIDEITVEHALAHRSGLPDVTQPEDLIEAALIDPAASLTPRDIVLRVQRVGELEFRPGQDYRYSNVNYILLGRLIENVSGQSYRQSLQENIFHRIGLQNTSLVGATYGGVDTKLARGYTTIGDVTYDGSEIGVEWAHAAGGIISTTGDLVAFFQALVAGQLFSDAATYARMHRPVGYNESYGLGIEITDDPEIGRYYFHRGNFMGSRVILAHFPDQGMTVAISHTYRRSSMSHPADLLRQVVRSVRGEAPIDEQPELVLEGPELLADGSNLVVNDDAPAAGEWDFAPQEEWSLDRLGHLPLNMIGDMDVDGEGSLYLLDRGTAQILVLDADGNLSLSFGGRGDGPRFESPQELFVTHCCIHALDMGKGGDSIKTFDKGGNHLKTTVVGGAESPRLFVDDDRYAAVRSGPDPLNRPAHEVLEIVSLSRGDRSTLLKFPAEDKLIMEMMVPKGRYILLENDIRIFPRLIVHFDGEMLYLGRSDAYVIKGIDLNGEVQLAFTVAGRERKPLPQSYVENRAGSADVPGGEMPEDAMKRFATRFPERQAFFTKIVTDERGLIYVFDPDLTDPATQAVNIFSSEGEYLNHALLQLPVGIERIRLLEFAGEHLYALAEVAEGGILLVKYAIRRPLTIAGDLSARRQGLEPLTF